MADTDKQLKRIAFVSLAITIASALVLGALVIFMLVKVLSEVRPQLGSLLFFFVCLALMMLLAWKLAFWLMKITHTTPREMRELYRRRNAMVQKAADRRRQTRDR